MQRLVLLLRSVLEARKRLMVTFNIPLDTLETVMAFLPALRAPTVSPLHHGQGYAVQIAAEASKVPALIPLIKSHGVTVVAVMKIRMLVA